MKIKDTLIIYQTNDFFNYMSHAGYELKKAYICRGMIDTSIRNKMSKAGFPFQSIWYNRELKNVKKNNILIYDPLITVEFIKWLRKYNPEKRIVFIYLNIVKMSINPELLKPYVEIYTWDRNDAKKYGLNMFKGTYWYKKIPKMSKKYDLVFVGRDKGRLESLLELERKLREIDLNPYFHIVGDHVISRNKKGYRYKKLMSYDEILNYTLSSKAILDMVQEGQVGYTLRTMESIFYGVKLVTNNVTLKSYDFYNDNNIFILGERNIKEMKTFLETPFEKIDDKILKNYTFESMISSLR